jgi:hypothetical protein
MASTRIIKELALTEYREIIDKYRDYIDVNPHAYFRIDEGQRKVYNDEYLKNTLREETPVLAGVQQNGKCAAFFNRKEGYLRIIFIVNHPGKIEIITFYQVDNLPKI